MAIPSEAVFESYGFVQSHDGNTLAHNLKVQLEQFNNTSSTSNTIIPVINSEEHNCTPIGLNLKQRKLNILHNSLSMDGENFCFPVPGGNNNTGCSGHGFK